MVEEQKAQKVMRKAEDNDVKINTKTPV